MFSELIKKLRTLLQEAGHSRGTAVVFSEDLNPQSSGLFSYLALVTPGAGRQQKGLFKGEQRALPSVSTGSPVSGSPGETAAGHRPRVLYLLTATERCPPPSPKMTNASGMCRAALSESPQDRLTGPDTGPHTSPNAPPRRRAKFPKLSPHPPSGTARLRLRSEFTPVRNVRTCAGRPCFY